MKNSSWSNDFDFELKRKKVLQILINQTKHQNTNNYPVCLSSYHSTKETKEKGKEKEKKWYRSPTVKLNKIS